MIFTQHFGALAARPVFPHITETEQERAPELRAHDIERDHRSERTAA